VRKKHPQSSLQTALRTDSAHVDEPGKDVFFYYAFVRFEKILASCCFQQMFLFGYRFL
jgi:hypothetical protein